MEDCFYCMRDERINSLMIPLVELEFSSVYLLRDQKYRGRCVVAFKRHVREIFEINPAERDGFFSDVSAVAKAIQQAFHPGKINYAVYGDLVSHFHVHLVPKQKGGLRWGEPFQETDTKAIADENELQLIADAILDQIL